MSDVGGATKSSMPGLSAQPTRADGRRLGWQAQLRLRHAINTAAGLADVFGRVSAAVRTWEVQSRSRLSQATVLGAGAGPAIHGRAFAGARDANIASRKRARSPPDRVHLDVFLRALPA
jgi:hypothetical protein